MGRRAANASGRSVEPAAAASYGAACSTSRGKRMRAFFALLFSLLVCVSAAAQGYPSRPIRLIVPFPPAGITDLSARLVGEGLRAKFGQPVIVENKPGANGLIGLREMLKAEADGYTLMAGTLGNLVIGYAMEANPPFDATRDFVPI